MHAEIIDFRPAGARTKATKRGLRPRNVVAWTDPETGAEWSDLVVEFVYARLGTALCHGCFGRMARDGGFKIEARPLPIDQLTITGHLPEAA